MPRRDGILAGYRGHVDAIWPVLSGWVAEIAAPDRPVRFSLIIEGHKQFTIVADRPRPDVAAAGVAAANCGFARELPARFDDGNEHAIAMRLDDGRDLNLPGLPSSVPVRPDLVPAADADLAAALDLLRRNDEEGGYDPANVTPINAAAFNAIASPAQGFLYYARAGWRLVGYGRIDRTDAHIGTLALTVLEAYRRRGLGEAILRALLSDVAQSPDMRQVRLAVRPDNAPAIQLYRKLGFRDQETLESGELAMVWVRP
jgi:ribosomal protein S18 acetylase RimI-like enzyme